MDASTETTCREMIATAREKLRAAEELTRAGFFNDSLSRAYYAAFHAVSMLLFLKGLSFSKHGQVLGAFNKEFVATGILPSALGKAIGNLFDERQSADYDVFQEASNDDASSGIADARAIIEAACQTAATLYGLRIED